MQPSEISLSITAQIIFLLVELNRKGTFDLLSRMIAYIYPHSNPAERKFLSEFIHFLISYIFRRMFQSVLVIKRKPHCICIKILRFHSFYGLYRLCVYMASNILMGLLSFKYFRIIIIHLDCNTLC